MQLYYILLIVLIFEIVLFILSLCLTLFYFKFNIYDSVNLLSDIYTIQGFFFAIIFLMLTHRETTEIKTSISNLHRHVTNNSMNENNV